MISLIGEGYQVIAIAPRDEHSKKLEQIGARFINIDIDSGGTNPIYDLKTLFIFKRIFFTK
ncbi:hypothetical protein [Aeromonas dhakensis]|uniref:hypothetical protein n=1 Tax=Aeromonas dhakensis TaxID=196024 RepID=UPI0024414B25|nr:hypothetical protein [Aeromonas dhakensis]